MKEHLNRYITYLKLERGLSVNSVDSYERDLHRFEAYLQELGIRSWTDVQRQHLTKYVHMLKEQGRKAATITRHIVSVRAFFHYLIAGGVIAQDPSLYMESPKPEKKEPTVLTIATTTALLDSPNTANASGKRDKAMLELLYATGIRVTELVSLDVEHVQLSLGYIQCTGSGMKERIVPIGSHAKSALNDYLAVSRESFLVGKGPELALFLNHLGTRMTRQGFWKMIKKYTREAGIEEEITPHTLRHSVAAHLLDNGADIRTVQELLGHADIATTLKYTKNAKGRMKDVYSSAHPRA